MPEPIRCPACDHEFSESNDSAATARVPEVTAEELASSGELYHSSRSRRGRSSPLAKSIRWLSLGVVVVAIAAVIYQAAATGSSQRPPRRIALDPKDLSTDELPLVTSKPPKLEEQPQIVAPPVDSAGIIRNSIVILETEDATGTTSLGTGFVVQATDATDAPLVAITNYHVLSAATSAYARFRDGSRHSVSGYWAISREMDLAALKLDSGPVNLAPLALSESPPRLKSGVTAVGHPQGLEFSVYPGVVSQLLDTNSLPASGQEYLRDMIRGGWNLHWIQHTARLTEGNSGGPLLNDQGEVVGVNTWTNHEAGFGYALDARHIVALLDQPLSNVTPLATYASRAALAAEARRKLSAQRLSELLEKCKAFGFVPASSDQYRELQELAITVTYAGRQPSLPPNSVRGRQREAMLAIVDQTAHALRERDWNTIGATTIVNDFAVEEVDRAMAGLFAFAVVDRIVTAADGTRGMLMTIAGTEREIFVLLDALLIEPEPATHFLIVGMNFQGQVVRYGDNPLDLNEVPVIVAARDGIIEVE